MTKRFQNRLRPGPAFREIPPDRTARGPLSKSLARVRRTLLQTGPNPEILEMPKGRPRRRLPSRPDREIIPFQGAADGHVVLFLTAGGNRVDPAKAPALAGAPLGKADAALIRAETGFAIGGVAPVGHLGPIHAGFDPRLLNFERVRAAAGTQRYIFAVDPRHILRHSGAEVAVFTEQAERTNIPVRRTTLIVALGAASVLLP